MRKLAEALQIVRTTLSDKIKEEKKLVSYEQACSYVINRPTINVLKKRNFHRIAYGE
jgi:hypothetical protein